MLHSPRADSNRQSHRPSDHTPSHTLLQQEREETRYPVGTREEEGGRETIRVQSGIADTRQQVKDTNGDITEGKKGSLMAQSSSHTSGNSPSATPTGRLTPRERRALAHIHSSCSSLSRGHGSRGSSPLASSWESFSRGVTLREKQQGRKQERLEHGERMERRSERKEDRELEDRETRTAVAEAPLLKEEEDEGTQGLMKHPLGRKKVR